MSWYFRESDPPTLEENLFAIETISTRAAQFWRKSHGWAPKEAAELLSKSRLDWLASFSKGLSLRVREVTAHPDEPAVLILAWVHLRTLVEGHLKLFLSVFLLDYLADIHAPRFKQQIVKPQALKLEAIRHFLSKRGLLTEHHTFIEFVQQRGNAIHAFADKPIGTSGEFLDCIPLYRRFLDDVEGSLPTPEPV